MSTTSLLLLVLRVNILVAVVLIWVTADKRDPDAWRRREVIFMSNPLFGRTIGRYELEALEGVIEAAALLPRRSAAAMPNIAFLIQGEEDTSEKEAAMWSSQSDAYVLTFLTYRTDALYFPNSLLAEGRNVLFAAACLEEFRRGYRYDYYAMLDADAVSTPAWAEVVPMFSDFLREWEPAVGLPVYGDGPADRFASATEPQSVFHFDHIFVAIHADAAHLVLPYDPTHDHVCAWVSQWYMTLLAQALFRNHTLLLPSFRIHNPIHSKYPKDDCIKEMSKASGRLRDKAPDHATNCFPDPIAGGVLFPGEPGMQKVRPAVYLPWGAAKKKGTGADAVNYSAASLDDLPSCDDEGTALAMGAKSDYWWCHGCPPQAAFYMLQTMVAARPYSSQNWNLMSILIFNLLGDLPAAYAAVKIAMRLEHRLGMTPARAVEQNVALLEQTLVGAGFTMRGDALWDEDGARADKMIRTVLTAHHGQDLGESEQEGALLSDASIKRLVQFLVTDSVAK